MTSPLSSLTNRIFLASTLLATISIGFAVYFVRSLLRAEAEAALQRDLTAAAALVEEQRDTLLDTFTRTARLVADLPKLKAALETRDPPTVAPIARDYQEQVGADLFRVTDPGGLVLAEHGGERPGVLEVVTVPVVIGLERPDLLGTLTLGFRLDDERAAVFKALTGADIAFALDGRIRSATLPPLHHAALERLLASGTGRRIEIGGEEYVVRVTPLAAAPGAPAGAPAPVAIVLRSRTERLRTLSAMETGLGAVAALTLVLAAALSYGVARTVTRPLARITDHMRQIAATGDLTRKLDVIGARWQDEDARVLATTFNTLTESIARFQREAAQRERLSSLGRMSTVIAHEIRNPLMIIKGALRQLRREPISREDILDAAADIDGEIERLNRVVNEVLDFARPIRIERSPTDVNAVCREAIAAVTAAEPDPAVAATLDPAVPVLQTDPERLRTALVNLLTNARQAVLALDGAAPDDGPGVRLTTASLPSGRVAVVIADRGAGIAAEDLPRIFDPYFTTRRGGSGLGLPIAKNIVDGLGGTLAVASAPGAGTTIRIELGDAPLPRS
jgi:signal transduction histidine kinase